MLSLCFIFAFYVKICEGRTYDFDIQGEDQHGYYITINLGTPPQKINLLLDTGSSNIALAVVPTNTDSKKYFHYNESQTLRPLEIAVDLRYIVGQWNGFLAKEIIHLGNETLEITIACMVSISQIFDVNSQFQGLLGLGYPSIAIPDASVEPFFDKLVKTQNVSNIFCLDLCGPYFTSQEQRICGKFHMGSIPKKYSSDEIIYTPVIKEWYYEVMLSGLRVGKIHVPFSCRELNKDRTVVDSGTTELYLPEIVYHWTVNEIKHHVIQYVPNSYWMNETVACVPNDKFKISVFPVVTLSLYHSENSTFNLLVSPELYLLRITSQSADLTCFKLSLSIADGGTLIGSSILKGFFVVFDRQNKRIGFANSKKYNHTTGYPGSVMKPKYTNQAIKWCKHGETKSVSDITPVMVVLLCAAVIISIVLLYMLVSWIFRHFFVHSDDSSETSSLVGNDIFKKILFC